jgi:hypothetical protein
VRITSSDIAFSAEHYKDSSEHYTKKTTQQRTDSSPFADASIDVVELSYNAKMRSEQATKVQSQSHVKLGDDQAAYHRNQATHALTQTSIGLSANIMNLSVNSEAASLIDPASTKAYTNIERDSLSLSQGVNPEQARVDIKEQHTLYENERLHVGTQGKVTTADGREIDFMMQLEMTNDFRLEESLHIRSEQRELMDPLVINFDGGAASLTSTSFSFDLNADGKNEQISFVGQGSGFLALDENGDGKINDGSELFGTGDKNGFAHLAQYDDDNNKWIDENDAIFSKLKIWSKDENGVDQLRNLKDLGVGAIYLGSSAGSFDITDSQNNLLGQVKRSGVFLTEQGEVASIQELDLAIQKAPNRSTIDLSLDKIDDQLNDWQKDSQENASQLLNLNIEVPENNFANDEKDQDKSPSLLDLLFPEPGSKYDNQRQASKKQSTEQTSISTQQSSPLKINNEDDQPKRKVTLDDTNIDIFKRLNEKSTEKYEADVDTYAYLKDIIKSLVESNRQQIEQSNKSEK